MKRVAILVVLLAAAPAAADKLELTTLADKQAGVSVLVPKAWNVIVVDSSHVELVGPDASARLTVSAIPEDYGTLANLIDKTEDGGKPRTAKGWTCAEGAFRDDAKLKVSVCGRQPKPDEQTLLVVFAAEPKLYKKLGVPALVKKIAPSAKGFVAPETPEDGK